jgi:hypothetical protein
MGFRGRVPGHGGCGDVTYVAVLQVSVDGVGVAVLSVDRR